MNEHGRWRGGWVMVWMLAWLPAVAWAGERPNILWITAEDISPDLGCYGVDYAYTPNLDKLASQGGRYSQAFSIAGVCAPSRSALITGMYPTSIGTHHMRCKGVPPAYVKCFTEYLRAAGYYCTNRSKEDYNFDAPVSAWDESSGKAHWRNRPEGMPFFSVINLLTTHESRIRVTEEHFAQATKRVPDAHRHDPEAAVLPPYYPDTPIVRKDWARYHDLITSMDAEVGQILRDLEADGLAENTIVFFYGDHGRGLPRAKRWLYDSGLQVPLIVRWPGEIEPGSVAEELVSFVDFGPTVLSLAGVEVPEYMQGKPFLGEQKASPRDYVYAARDRMDEAYDMIRAVRDKRYKYIRNYQPGKPYAQFIGYMELMPTMQEMRRLHKAGKLVGPQKQYFLPEKPPEELYDLKHDPHEVHNLAGDWRHRDVLQRMSEAMDEWRRETGDLGLIPEAELWEKRRPGGWWENTDSPSLEVERTNEGYQVTLECETEGASIAWTTDAGKDARWRLYSKPFTLKEEPAHPLRAKAIRLGFRESVETRANLSKLKISDSLHEKNTSPGMDYVTFDTVRLMRARTALAFAKAAFLKPRDGVVSEESHRMAPLVVQEIGKESFEPWGYVDASDGLTVLPDRMEVYLVEREVKLGGQMYQQLMSFWFYPPTEAGGEARVRGQRLTLAADGYPVVWEAIQDRGVLRSLYVGKSFEEKAKEMYGEPLPGRGFSIEYYSQAYPRVVVARELEDGPMPMGPYVYLGAGTLDVTTLLCRCMPAQVNEFDVNDYYEPVVLEETSPMFKAICAKYPALAGGDDLDVVLRWPVK